MSPTAYPHTQRNTRLRVWGLGLGVALAVAGCSSNGDGANTAAEDCEPVAEPETINDGELTVLVAQHPPFISMSDNELHGIEGELVEKIAEDLCLELNASPASFTAVIEGLQSGRADLSAGQWTLNEERAELFEVSDPVYDGGGMGVVTQGEDWSTVGDLEDKSLGTPQGYLWVDDIEEVYGSDNISEYQSDDAVLDDVNAGRIDAGLVSSLANTWRLEEHDQYSDLTINQLEVTDRIPYTQEPPMAVVLIEDGNTNLRDATNTILEDFRESGDLGEAFEEEGLDADWAEVEDS